jgi:hypothetical protein
MRKLKMVLLTAAILIAISGAFATKIKLVCEGYPQYYWSGAGYVSAGTLGVDYDCDQTVPGSTCTYWIPDPIGHPNQYAACQPGTFINFH